MLTSKFEEMNGCISNMIPGINLSFWAFPLLQPIFGSSITLLSGIAVPLRLDGMSLPPELRRDKFFSFILIDDLDRTAQN